MKPKSYREMYLTIHIQAHHLGECFLNRVMPIYNNASDVTQRTRLFIVYTYIYVYVPLLKEAAYYLQMERPSGTSDICAMPFVLKLYLAVYAVTDVIQLIPSCEWRPTP